MRCLLARRAALAWLPQHQQLLLQCTHSARCLVTSSFQHAAAAISSAAPPAGNRRGRLFGRAPAAAAAVSASSPSTHSPTSSSNSGHQLPNSASVAVNDEPVDDAEADNDDEEPEAADEDDTADTAEIAKPTNDDDPADSYVMEAVYGVGGEINPQDLYAQKLIQYWIAAGGILRKDGVIEFSGELPDDDEVAPDDPDLRERKHSELPPFPEDVEGKSIGSSVGGEKLDGLAFQLREADLDEKFIRGGGRGGQKVNKTSNCVQLMHIPTNTRVKCHATRSLATNRIIARKIMSRRLDEILNANNSATRKEQRRIKKQKAKQRKRAKSKHCSNDANDDHAGDDLDVDALVLDVSEFADESSSAATSVTSHPAAAATTSASIQQASTPVPRPLDRKLIQQLDSIRIPSQSHHTYLMSSLHALTRKKQQEQLERQLKAK